MVQLEVAGGAHCTVLGKVTTYGLTTMQLMVHSVRPGERKKERKKREREREMFRNFEPR
jgi:hypothetical protein